MHFLNNHFFKFIITVIYINCVKNFIRVRNSLKSRPCVLRITRRDVLHTIRFVTKTMFTNFVPRKTDRSFCFTPDDLTYIPNTSLGKASFIRSFRPFFVDSTLYILYTYATYTRLRTLRGRER